MEQSKTYECKKKNFFRLIPSIAFILFGLLSIVFFFLPAGELLGLSTGSLYEIIFAKALIPPSFGFICHVIVAVATLVYGIWATVYLAKGNKYKYLIIDIVGLVLILGQIICAFITKSYVNGFLSDAGVGTILLLVFGFILLILGVVFTILHEVFAKKDLFDKGDKLFVRLPKVEPQKVSCPKNVEDISLKRRLTFQNTLGHLFATVFATAGIWVMMFNFSVILRRNSNGFSDMFFTLSIVFIAVSSAFAGTFFVVRLIMFFKNLSKGLKTPTEKTIKRSTRVCNIGVTTLLISLFAYVGDRALNAIQLIHGGRLFREEMLWQGDIGIYSQKMRLTFVTIASIFAVICIVLSVINKTTAKKTKLRFLGTGSANDKTAASLSIDEFIENVNLEKERLNEYKKYLKELNGYVIYKKLLNKGVDEKGNYVGKTVKTEPTPIEKPETTARSTRLGKIVIFDTLSWFKFFAYATFWIFAITKLTDLGIVAGGFEALTAFLLKNLSFALLIIIAVISAKLLGNKFNAIDRLPNINEATHVRRSSILMNVITTIFIIWKVLALILGENPSDSALIMAYTEVVVLTAVSFVISISIIVSAKFVRKDMIKFTQNNTDLSSYELKELAINETDELNKFRQYQKDVLLFNQQKQ